ncbi:hypothetical protein Ato02nite_012270 [Paractinoplanes toevensis]|uniref:Uncharacterized protein n=1 Tax=Paractinoplanes toevensis TaxID=571911 RepID=A0A919W0N5_9ACTN|nr:hypothetical protein Ato02nite_012270 [Actinoplanes toevensis]
MPGVKTWHRPVTDGPNTYKTPYEQRKALPRAGCVRVSLRESRGTCWCRTVLAVWRRSGDVAVGDGVARTGK